MSLRWTKEMSIINKETFLELLKSFNLKLILSYLIKT
jgi:hypothetical protein